MKIALREGVLYLCLTFYILYAFAAIGITGLLFSLAVGLIVLSFKTMKLSFDTQNFAVNQVPWYFGSSRAP